MTILTANGQTLNDVVKAHGPDGNMMTIAEILHQKNEIMDDIVWREANDIFSNTGIKRASLPTGSWRKLNQGTASEKSDTIQIRDVVGILDTWAKNDVEVINAYKNPQQARSDLVKAFIEGLSQTMVSTLLYGNTASTPEQFLGLAPRLASLATTTNVLNEGGTGSDLSSIFVVDWGPDTAHMLYPRNSEGGLKHEDMGKQIVQDASNNDFLAFVDHFVWKAGLTIKNDKSIGRIANIETSGQTNIFDEDNLITLLNRMTKGPGRRIYCNETVMTQMEIRLKDKTNVHFSKDDGLAPGGVMMFKKVPIRQVDKILDTEAALT